jgi:hypothetical protein
MATHKAEVVVRALRAKRETQVTTSPVTLSLTIQALEMEGDLEGTLGII